ncbi:MAG: ATP-binding protein [Planctomycetes bacterium]|nr:ATP-binding protein [Planctomycetota bacterium]
MRIAIASGKGGTGKTTVAVSLALARGNVQVLDCDVEDPDAALLLHPQVSCVEPVTVLVPELVPERCTSCSECAAACAFGAIVFAAGRFFLNEELCKDCGACYLVCGEQALAPRAREIGTLTRGEARAGVTLISGNLHPGEAMASPLIERVKARAAADRPVIIDAPPGTACSMVHAIEGANLCVLVTEPTPYGRHDLEQALDVAALLKIRTAVVINRSDLGDSGVRGLCAARGVPVLMEIPFDQGLAEAYAAGRPALEAGPRFRPLFEELWDRVVQAAGSAERFPTRSRFKEHAE